MKPLRSGLLATLITAAVMLSVTVHADSGVAGEGAVTAAGASDDRPLIEPDIVPVPVKEDLIDTEDFEIGFYTGIISIEDFETPLIVGLRLAYHLSESLFLETNLAFTEAGETSFEKLGGDVQLLTEDDRAYTYYNLSLGYNVLPGEAFIGRRYAFNTNLYLVGGMGAVEFAGDSYTAFNYGFGYQILFTDWLALHLRGRQYLYDIDLLGEEKTAHDLELTTGLSLYF